jgi:hypothetical protein
LLLVRVDNSSHTLQLHQQLVQRGFAVSHLWVVETMLESIFLALTESGAEAKA